MVESSGDGGRLGDLASGTAACGRVGFASGVCWLLVRDHNAQLDRAVASDRRHRNLARFFPPSVLTELQASRLRLELDRRRVAVMFLDLRSFTRYSETAPPEDVAELIAAYRELVTWIVFQYGGVIDKFLGDGIMIVFGHPHVGPDDANRAFHCAMALQAALANWASSRQMSGKSALNAGIGLHIGVVVAGILQSASHDEFTLFGDTVNVAQRLERLCKSLEASLVISSDLAASANLDDPVLIQMVGDTVVLEGRERPVDVFYLPRTAANTGKESG
jgi:adenylate cyclase